MHIDVFTTVRDEATILPHFLDHYAFADRIFVMDDGSVDGSPDLVRACPNATLLPFPFTSGFDETAISDAYVRSYRAFSRGVADWVLVPDVDEFLYHPDGMRAALDAEPTPAILRTHRGYHMVCETFPTGPGRLTDLVREGSDAGTPWRKPIIFTPDVDVSWGKGRHTCYGPHKRDTSIVLLHYRFLGLDWLLARTERNITRAFHSSDANRRLIVGDDLQQCLDVNLAKARVRFAAAMANRQPVC